jgi:hypothetical protein
MGIGPQWEGMARWNALGEPRRVFRNGTSAPLRATAVFAVTEAERLVVQRIGQDIFRARLMIYWQGRCPLTGISDPALLREFRIMDLGTGLDQYSLGNRKVVALRSPSVPRQRTT